MTFAITYNGYEISDDPSSNAMLLDGFAYSETAESVEFSVSFLLQRHAGDTDTFDELESAMFASLSEPEHAYEIARDGAAVYRGDPAEKTAFLITTTIAADPDSERDSDTSARYRFSLRAQRPWARSTEPNRRDASWSLSYTPSRQRMLTISGVYTAGTATTAYDSYSADFATYAASVIAIVGGVYEDIGEGPIVSDQFDGLCSFRAVYREMGYTTGASGVRDETIVFTPSRSRKASPLRLPVTVAYSASVNRSTTGETALPALWDTITTTLAAKAVALYSRSAAVIESAERGQGSDSNTLTGTLRLVLVGSGYTYRRRAQLTVNADASGRRNLTLAGGYTSDGTSGSRSFYDADIETWSTTAKNLIDSGATWRLILDVIGPEDDDQEETAFTRVYEEVLYTADATAMRDESFAFRRLNATRIGSRGNERAVTGEVVYRGVAHTSAAIDTLWDSTLRSALLAKLASKYGGSPKIEVEDVATDDQARTISARCIVHLDGVGSNVIAYEEAVGVRHRIREKYLDRYDGKRQSYHHWVEGEDVFGVAVVISHVVGAMSMEPEEPIMPPPPPAFGAESDGTWRKMSQDVDPVIEDRVGLPGETRIESRKTTVTAYRWIAASSVEVGASADGGVTVPTGGSFTQVA